MKPAELTIGERYRTPDGEGVLYLIADNFVKLRRDDRRAIKCPASRLRPLKSTAAPTVSAWNVTPPQAS